MTTKNIVELIVLLFSIPAVAALVKTSNGKVADLDGLGEVMKKDQKKGAVIAHF